MQSAKNITLIFTLIKCVALVYVRSVSKTNVRKLALKMFQTVRACVRACVCVCVCVCQRETERERERDRVIQSLATAIHVINRTFHMRLNIANSVIDICED